MACALSVALLTSTGVFAQVPPADPGNPNEGVPEASNPPPYGAPINLETAKKAAAPQSLRRSNANGIRFVSRS